MKLEKAIELLEVMVHFDWETPDPDLIDALKLSIEVLKHLIEPQNKLDNLEYLSKHLSDSNPLLLAFHIATIFKHCVPQENEGSPVFERNKEIMTKILTSGGVQ